jgi:hypothetical protein
MSLSNHILPGVISRLAPCINQIVADNHYGFQGRYRLCMCSSCWRASGVRLLSYVGRLKGTNCCSVLSLNSVYPLFNSNTGRFIMLSVITNIYNKKTKGATLMEFFTATGKLKKFFVDNERRSMCAPRVTRHTSIRYSSSCHTSVNTRGARFEHL